MKTKKHQIVKAEINDRRQASAGVIFGQIKAVDEHGQLLVDFPDNLGAPVPARMTRSFKSKTNSTDALIGRQVLLVFENNDAELPIIVDTIYSLVDEITEIQSLNLEADRPQEALIDGKRIVLEAEEEIILRCGQSSILLKKDGKIVIRGTDLLSRSSGPNKVKGATIAFN